MSLKLLKDTISPDLRRRASAAANKRPLLEAMGMAALSLGKQAFTDASKRPNAWAPRKDSNPKPLLLGSILPKKQGGGTSPPTLEPSLRIINVSANQVIIGSDRPYAAIHQLGGEHIPARPYLPFYQSGQMTALGKQRVERALVAALRVRGL